ncbi:MAG: hypothetical protein ACYCYK_12945 [Candidatus Dormibacteria bacterium]
MAGAQQGFLITLERRTHAVGGRHGVGEGLRVGDAIADVVVDGLMLGDAVDEGLGIGEVEADGLALGEAEADGVAGEVCITIPWICRSSSWKPLSRFYARDTVRR